MLERKKITLALNMHKNQRDNGSGVRHYTIYLFRLFYRSH